METWVKVLALVGAITILLGATITILVVCEKIADFIKKVTAFKAEEEAKERWRRLATEREEQIVEQRVRIDQLESELSMLRGLGPYRVATGDQEPEVPAQETVEEWSGTILTQTYPDGTVTKREV